MALYGSVPLLLAHSAARSAAMLWLNPSETFVHVHRTAAGDGHDGDLHTRWVSEAGVLDAFLMLGPRPHDLFRQYAALTGTTQLPPVFLSSSIARLFIANVLICSL